MSKIEKINKILRTKMSLVATLIALILLTSCIDSNYQSIDINSQLKELFGIRETQKVTSQNVDYALKLSFVPSSLKLNVGEKKPVELIFELKMDYIPENAFLYSSGFDPNLMNLNPKDFSFGKINFEELKELKIEKKVVEIEGKAKLSTTLYFFLFYGVKKEFDFSIIIPIKSGEVQLIIPKIKIPIMIEKMNEKVEINKDKEKIVLDLLLHNIGQGNIFNYEKINDDFKGYDSLDDNDFDKVDLTLNVNGKNYKCQVGKFINDYARALCKFETNKPEKDNKALAKLQIKFGYINIFPYRILIQ